MISTDAECSFSRETLVSPPITITIEVASVSIGQNSLSQTRISSLPPSHAPYKAGFLIRTLVSLPPPQVLEHSLHSVQSDHWHPWIISAKFIINVFKFLIKKIRRRHSSASICF